MRPRSRQSFSMGKQVAHPTSAGSFSIGKQIISEGNELFLISAAENIKKAVDFLTAQKRLWNYCPRISKHWISEDNIPQFQDAQRTVIHLQLQKYV